MRTLTRRDFWSRFCSAVPAFAIFGSSAARAMRSQDKPAAPPSPNPLAAARVFPYDEMQARTTPAGGETRNITHGTLATGETVNLHQSMQPAGAAPPALHVIQHTEFLLVREGELEFQHETPTGVVNERVGPGGVIYVAFGTRHAIKNAGQVPARYFVVGMGGDAK